MTIIPSCEIKQPSLHADTLGFTFIWNNHFLRGIYPAAVEQAKGYFESGFIDEVVSKGLFPKTWISDFENEQFGMILEHEMITPVLYAMEWNFSMLKDAALMVLDIAQIGWKYGYNMVDCHKLNVLFLNNHPMYVDLGSFVPRQAGETGWKPYDSFLQSYYNILMIWSDGASQIAKRLMAPGLEFNTFDYFLYQRKIYRFFPKLAKKRIWLNNLMSHMVAFGNHRFLKELEFLGYNNSIIRGAVFAKKLANKLKLLPSQNIRRIKRKVNRLQLSCGNSNALQINNIGYIIDALTIACPNATSATIVDCRYPQLYQFIIEQTEIKTIVSICQEELLSNVEYNYYKNKNYNICCTQFQLLNNSVVITSKLPEPRLSSDIVVIYDYVIPEGAFGIHNAIVFFNRCMAFSNSKLLLVNIRHASVEQRRLLSQNGFIVIIDNWYVSKR